MLNEYAAMDITRKVQSFRKGRKVGNASMACVR